jgi:hypothetical protein
MNCEINRGGQMASITNCNISFYFKKKKKEYRERLDYRSTLDYSPGQPSPEYGA